MNNSFEQYMLRVMRGTARGPVAGALRGVLAAVEPVYAAVVAHRNRRFDLGRGVRRLPVPVISVGNLTAGGTGKTPVVQWMFEKLREAGHHPAVLMRGYRSSGGISDEQQMLLSQLSSPGSSPPIVQINPDRYAGGTQVLSDHPGTDVFILDDGFQHRRLARDFDLVLVNATEPFGLDHIHPRGLLRESLQGFTRASAVLITRSDEVDPETRLAIEQKIHSFHAMLPIFHASHVHARLIDDREVIHPMDELGAKRVFAFCGIGDPDAFLKQVGQRAGAVAGSRVFRDHHDYGPEDLQSLEKEAAAHGAQILLTTEKDWVKLKKFAHSGLSIWRTEMRIGFRPGDEVKLFDSVLRTLERSPALSNESSAVR